MDFPIRMSGDDLVHEVEKLDAPPPFVVVADDLVAAKVESCEQRGRSMPLVIVGLARHGAPVRKLQAALRALQRLNRRLFVDGEHDGVLGRRHIEPDNLRRIGGKFGIVAEAPRLAPGKVDLLTPQETPDILDIDVAEALARSGPVQLT